MSTCTYCEGRGELCDLCCGSQAEEPFRCSVEDCPMEFCVEECRTDHLELEHVSTGGG